MSDLDQVLRLFPNTKWKEKNVEFCGEKNVFTSIDHVRPEEQVG